MARPRSTAAPETEPADTREVEPEVEQAADPPTVIQALSRVMGDVQSISKTSRNESQGFNFRGIDAVMNAVGPALREHGVVVVPINTEYEFENYTTSRGTAMKGVMLTVTFRFYGPAGDYIDACATGESSDSGDKAMPKAHSVAFRTLLLQALCIPTDEPDPDLESHQRAAGPFQGSTGKEPRAREREAKPTYNFPKDWKELGERMGALLGKEESLVWMAQAKEVGVGAPPDTKVSDLEDEARRDLWRILTEVLRSLDEELKVDPDAFPPPTREEIAGEFAKHLDGTVIAGPQWALSGEEAEAGVPSKEDVLGEHDNQRPVSADGDPEESDAETAAAESREPTEEEIAEAQQALLDEDAKSAAESEY